MLFLFASLSIFLQRNAPKKVFLVNQNGGQGPLGPDSDGTEFAK